LTGLLLCLPSLAIAGGWTEHSIRLGQLKVQIETAEKEIQELIEEKQHTKDEEHIFAIMHRISEHHKAIEKYAHTYEEERQHVRFEHPEKNDQIDRVYKRQRAKSVDQLESEIGIEVRLDRVRDRVLAKFPIPEDKKVSAARQKFRTRLPASSSEIAPEEMHEKIILRK
jgi:hypothetical protein